jgi:adenylosuccinate synthase
MISIVTDLAFGDSSKGKTTAYLSQDADIVVKVGGGPQAGHVFTTGMFACQIPSGVVNPNATLCIGRGTVLNPIIVMSEIQKYNVQDRIWIDPGCTIIEQQDIDGEQDLVKRIGSVGQGVGPARVRRIMRTAKIARDIPELKPYLRDVSKYIIENKYKNIILEGVQGYGLDLYNAEFYPYVTSQSTLASQFAADAGIGPRDVNNVYGVCKAYTTRVGPGYLFNEWDEERRLEIGERGTISGRLRRVGDFDVRLVKEAINANSVSHLVIGCLDRLFPSCKGVHELNQMPQDAYEFIENIVQKLNFKDIVFAGTGEDFRDIVRLGIV